MSMNTATRIDTETLSHLITHAASDWLRRTEPQAALEVGLSIDPRLGTWNQGTWGSAERNGVCQTAFCIAGGAAVLNREHVLLMSWDGEDWSTDIAIPRRNVPEWMEVRWGLAWAPKFGDEHYDEWREWDIYDHGATSVRTLGKNALGLNESEASALFSGDNGIEDVVSLSVYIAEQHGQTLDLPDWVVERFYDESLPESHYLL